MAPVAVTASQASTGKFDATFIEVQGRLTAKERGPENTLHSGSGRSRTIVPRDYESGPQRVRLRPAQDGQQGKPPRHMRRRSRRSPTTSLLLFCCSVRVTMSMFLPAPLVEHRPRDRHAGRSPALGSGFGVRLPACRELAAPRGSRGTGTAGARDARHSCAELRRDRISIAGNPQQAAGAQKPRFTSNWNWPATWFATATRKRAAASRCCARNRWNRRTCFPPWTSTRGASWKAVRSASSRKEAARRDRFRCAWPTRCSASGRSRSPTPFDMPIRPCSRSGFSTAKTFRLSAGRGQRHRLYSRRRISGFRHSWNAPQSPDGVSHISPRQHAGEGTRIEVTAPLPPRADLCDLAEAFMEVPDGVLDPCPTFEVLQFAFLSWMIIRWCWPD